MEEITIKGPNVLSGRVIGGQNYIVVFEGKNNEGQVYGAYQVGMGFKKEVEKLAQSLSDQGRRAIRAYWGLSDEVVFKGFRDPTSGFELTDLINKFRDSKDDTQRRIFRTCIDSVLKGSDKFPGWSSTSL